VGLDPAARERVLDAVEMSVERYGVDKITMETVAGMAKVSRGFVYKHFGSKDAVILAMLVRRAEQFNERARAFLEAQPNLEESLVQGIVLGARIAFRDPYFGLLVGSAMTDPVHQIGGANEQAFRLATELWRPILETGRERGELAPGIDLDELVQWIMYLMLLLLAGRRTFGADDAAQERQLRTFFVPAIVSGERVIDLAGPAPGRSPNGQGRTGQRRADRVTPRGGNLG
jgi:AcrR family transcriptional regulator